MLHAPWFIHLNMNQIIPKNKITQNQIHLLIWTLSVVERWNRRDKPSNLLWNFH